MKKALQLATKANMIDQFNIKNIQILQNLGYEVDVIADFSEPGTITKERALSLKNELSEIGVNVIDVSMPRKISPKAIIEAYKKIKKIISHEHYKIIHCHSPIGSAICRIAAISCKKSGAKVIYTAHGFHFYKGAPLKNWILFFPIELFLSLFTDILITINKEDYQRATKLLKAKKTIYIPGVGVNINNFSFDPVARHSIRKELGICDDETVLLSVGELNKNKNHKLVINAVSTLNIKYIIVGIGELAEELISAAKESGVNLILVGYKNNIKDYLSAADYFIMPSFREGLSMSLMEAMAIGLPCAVSRIRGNTDLIDCDGGTLFSPKSTDDAKTAIIEIMSKDYESMKNHNKEKILHFSVDVVSEKMTSIYSNCDREL